MQVLFFNRKFSFLLHIIFKFNFPNVFLRFLQGERGLAPTDPKLALGHGLQWIKCNPVKINHLNGNEVLNFSVPKENFENR